MREESSGKPDAWKLARPVWGWGRGEIPRPTPPSRSKYTQDQVEESAAQLLLYGELAKDFAPNKRLRLQFGVLTKTKEVSVDVHSVLPEQAQLDRTKRVIERVWNAIQADNFFPTPLQMNCPGCPYREPCRKWPG